MAFEKVLTLLLLVSLALKNSNSSLKSLLFEQDVYGNWRTTFQGIVKSDLVWKYAFQNCRQASKIHKASRLLRYRALIIMLLILGCVESHPGPSTSFNVGKFSYIFFQYESEITKLNLVSCTSSRLRLRQRPNFESKQSDSRESSCLRVLDMAIAL